MCLIEASHHSKWRFSMAKERKERSFSVNMRVLWRKGTGRKTYMEEATVPELATCLIKRAAEKTANERARSIIVGLQKIHGPSVRLAGVQIQILFLFSKK